MTRSPRRLVAALTLSLLTVPALQASGHAAPAPEHDAAYERKAASERKAAPAPVVDPVVIGHRGASGYRPEHTLASYRLAIAQGADYIEPDLVSTKDGVLVARHENEIGGTTDVAEHPEFAGRRTTKVIDGRRVTGWFTEDFTLAELKTLRAEERLPQVRPDNTAYDGQLEIPTFTEVLNLARAASRRTGRTIGVYPETKHPTYFDSIGLSLEEPLVAQLRQRDLDDADDPVIIQSFEVANLVELNDTVDTPIAQLVDASGAPYDTVAAGAPTPYSTMVTPAGLAAIAAYADGVGAHKNLVLPPTSTEPTAMVGDAHDAGLVVHIWTLRRENQFMAPRFRVGTDPNAPGDMAAETRAFLDAGVDGVFSDNPDLAVGARDAWLQD